MMLSHLPVIAFLASLTLPSQIAAGERIAGPLRATVERIVDGDTIAVTAQVWLGLTIATSVRLRGIDTPELRGACAEEDIAGAKARLLVGEAAGDAVWLTNIEQDKYAGRVIADVTDDGGRDIAGLLVAEGLAIHYDGGQRTGWCPESAE
jgi:micrococcal nuclease